MGIEPALVGFPETIEAPFGVLRPALVSLVLSSNRHQTDTKTLFDHFSLVPTRYFDPQTETDQNRRPYTVST
jgi:hypothetical protein